MKRWLTITLMTSLIGCGHPIPPKMPRNVVDDINQATMMVWHQLLGESLPPPRVDWVSSPWLDCAEGTGFYIPENNHMCVWGVFYQEGDYAKVSAMGENAADMPVGFGGLISKTAFAHELYHAHLRITTGMTDPDHVGAGWKMGGTVEVADGELRAAGL